MAILPIDRLPAIGADTNLSLDPCSPLWVPDTVDVWCFFYEDSMRDDALRARYESLMSDDERARHQRLLFEDDKRLYLATRALARTVLSRYVACEPAACRFAIDSHGKPHLVDGALSFNLTNTRGLVCCAVSRPNAQVGVDAENIERKSETVAIADRYFSRSEVRALQALPSELQRERFFSYWTLKESYIKARGLGLAIPLGQFSFELDQGDDIGIAFEPRLDDDPARWRFRLLRASPRHFVAVALDAGAMRLRVAAFTPLSGHGAFPT